MIQRIQSIYLFLVVMTSWVLSMTLPFEVSKENAALYAQDNLIVLCIFALSGLLALITIFLFKNRKLQFILGRINIILNFILLGVFVYWSLNTPGGGDPLKGVGKLIPIISIVLLVMANKAIKKDEDLVKSVDRLR